MGLIRQEKGGTLPLTYRVTVLPACPNLLSPFLLLVKWCRC